MLNIKQINVEKELKTMKENFQVKSIERTSEDIDPIMSLNFFTGFQISEELVKATNLLRVFNILVHNLRDYYFGFNKNIEITIMKNNQSIFVNHLMYRTYEDFEKIIKKNNAPFDNIVAWSIAPARNPEYLFVSTSLNCEKYLFEHRNFSQSSFFKKVDQEDFTENIVIHSIRDHFIYFLTHSKKFKNFIESNNLLITGVKKEQNANLFSNFKNNTQNLLYVLSFISTKDISLKKTTEEFKEVVEKNFVSFLNYLNAVFKGEEDYLRLKIQIKKENQKFAVYIFANTKTGFKIQVNPLKSKVNKEKLQILQNKINDQLKEALKNSRQKLRTKKMITKQDLGIEDRCINYDDLIKAIMI